MFPSALFATHIFYCRNLSVVVVERNDHWLYLWETTKYGGKLMLSVLKWLFIILMPIFFLLCFLCLAMAIGKMSIWKFFKQMFRFNIKKCSLKWIVKKTDHVIVFVKLWFYRNFGWCVCIEIDWYVFLSWIWECKQSEHKQCVCVW